MFDQQNPWEAVTLQDYESHMSLPQVQQLQALNYFMKKQLEGIAASTVVILGVAGGNGLEYINMEKHKTVYGIDVNEDFLHRCEARFQELKGCLVLQKKDLLDEAQTISQAECIIANLVIEYLGVKAFVRNVGAAGPKWVSCVIQKNPDETFVSESSYTRAFDEISAIHRDIEEDELVAELEKIGYQLTAKEAAVLPNKKQFIKLDFCK